MVLVSSGGSGCSVGVSRVIGRLVDVRVRFRVVGMDGNNL